VREQPKGDAVYFGATVKVLHEEGEPQEYRIVGPDEADGKNGAISVDSPLAQALLGKRVDDDVEIVAAGKEQTVSVVSIRY
jgi:transcription elongation factor GreB